MKLFAEMIIGREVNKNPKLNNTNELISFFVLGLPFFIELFITFYYREPGYELVAYNHMRTIMRIFELIVIFSSLFILFITAQSNFIRRIALLLWLLILYIPAALEFICSHITGTFISNDFMFAIFNTDLRETLFVIKECFIFILTNFVIICYTLRLKPKRRYLNKKYAICAAILLAFSILFSDFQPFNNIASAFSAYVEDLKNADQFCKMQTPIQGIETKMKGKQTYIFVIGESVDRKHMGIYGYDRQTTPYFEKIKDELFLF